MSGYYEALTSNIRQAVCTAFSNAETGVGIMQRQIGVAAPILLPAAALARTFRRGACGQPALPNPEPPSTGGQCQCAAYQVEVVYTRNGQTFNNLYIADGLTTMNGPMTYNGPSPQVPGSLPGLSVTYSLCSGGNITQRVTTVLGSFIDSDTEIVSVTFSPRFPSQPNDCGDQTPIIPPVTRPDVTFTFPNFTWVTNEGDTVNEGDLNITLGFAYIDANANFRIPVEINLGIDSIFGDINQNGDVNFDFSRNTDYSFPDAPSIDPGDNEDLPPPVEAPPSPERNGEQVIIGVVVTVTQLGLLSATEIMQQENPNIFGPRLGSVNFLYRVGGRNAAWSKDIDVKNIRQLIECPWPHGAIDVKGTPQSGVSWVLTPIRSRVDVPIFPGT